MPQYFEKDPQGKVPYSIDWGKKFLPVGDTITTSTWTVSDPAITIVGTPGITVDGRETTVWLSGGTADTLYEATNHIISVGGIESDESIFIHVKQL